LPNGNKLKLDNNDEKYGIHYLGIKYSKEHEKIRYRVVVFTEDCKTLDE